MLALTRKELESVVIDRDIVVTVISIKGNKVRLGFKAPEDIAVHRKEVFDSVERLAEMEGDEAERIAVSVPRI